MPIFAHHCFPNIHWINLRYEKIFQNLRYGSLFDGASKQGIMDLLVANYYRRKKSRCLMPILLHTQTDSPASLQKTSLTSTCTCFQDPSSFLRRPIILFTPLHFRLDPPPISLSRAVTRPPDCTGKAGGENSISYHSLTGCHTIKHFTNSTSFSPQNNPVR